VETRYGKNNRPEYERYTVIAMSSLYGIDILKDNVIEFCTETYLVIGSYKTKKDWSTA
jgi:hypothetical protein